jgi:hypothetical protein
MLGFGGWEVVWGPGNCRKLAKDSLELQRYLPARGCRLVLVVDMLVWAGQHRPEDVGHSFAAVGHSSAAVGHWQISGYSSQAVAALGLWAVGLG